MDKKFTLLLLPGIFGFTFSLFGQQPGRHDDPGDCCGKADLIDELRASTVDTIECKSWNSQTGNWAADNITINTRDEYGRLVLSSGKNFDDALRIWVPSHQFIYSWYANDSLASEAYFVWNDDLNDGSWDPLRNTQYEYDSQDRLIYTFYQYSQYGSTEMVNGGKTWNYYGPYGRQDSAYLQYWNTSANAWYYSYRYRWQYDDNGNITAVYHDYANNPDPGFQYGARYVYGPGDIENQRKVIEQQYYNDTWNNYRMNIYTYNLSGQKTTRLWQMWDQNAMAWDTLIMMRDFYEYTPAGEMSEHIQQSHYFEWFNMYREVWTYDENNNLASHLDQDWNSYSEIWVNDEMCIYPPPQSITGLPVGTATGKPMAVISPNPAVSAFSIRGDFDRRTVTTVQIFNPSGQLVRHYDDLPESIPVHDLQTGVYFVRISAKGFETVQMLIRR